MDDTGQGPNPVVLTVFWLAVAYSMYDPKILADHTFPPACDLIHRRMMCER